MCGIVAIIAKRSPEQVRAALVQMVRAQVHRGPDDEGVQVLPLGCCVVGLANRRLAIQDLSALGHMPMQNPDVGDVVTYNGEIYNAPELRARLESEGYSFRGRSDTEVLLRAYEHWGVDCLDRLRGMFAFALWDARRRRLVLARDCIGIKPLYYSEIDGGGFVCASEVRAVQASDLVAPGVDKRALAGYLAYGAAQEPLTMVRGVRAVPAGSWMEVDNEGGIVGTRKYWVFPAPDRAMQHVPLNSLVEEGRSLLEQSVTRHMLSDVPVGLFLSSGLDSTSLLGLLRKVAAPEVHSFTVAFPDYPQFDESAVAADLARLHDSTHHKCDVDDAKAMQWAQEGLQRMDQPAMDGINTYIVSRAVRSQQLIVALSGLGGDELFGGYRSYRGIPRLFKLIQRVPVGNGTLELLARLATLGSSTVTRRKAVDIARTGPNLAGLYFQHRRVLCEEDIINLGLGAQRLGLTSSYHLPENDASDCEVPGDPIATVVRLETRYYLGNVLLRDADVYGMANSLEVRVPFLDRDVIDWALHLPGSVLLPSRAPGKFLLREICRSDRLPTQKINGKRFFTLPFSAWIRGPLRELTEDCLREVKSEGLDAKRVDQLWALFLREPGSAAWSRIWALVALGHWMKSRAVKLTYP